MLFAHSIAISFLLIDRGLLCWKVCAGEFVLESLCWKVCAGKRVSIAARIITFTNDILERFISLLLTGFSVPTT